MKPRILFYTQHLLGIGHLVRADLIAQALLNEGAEVTFVTGGSAVQGFPRAKVDLRPLPVIKAGPSGFSDLVDETGQPVTDDFKIHRKDSLLEMLNEVKPDALIIVAFPFGRRQMRFELLPLLEKARQQQPRPLIISSVRDILQPRPVDREEETLHYLERFFDAVIVHGDQSFADPRETFSLTLPQAKLHYSGIVAAPIEEFRAEPDGAVADIIVSAGGGAAGEKLFEALAEMPVDGPLSAYSWLVLTGMNADQAAVQRLAVKQGLNFRIERHRPDFRALLGKAKLSVSQAGYNTTADLLQAGCRNILVPFSAAGEQEQTLRANRLAEWGISTVLPEEQLNGANLKAAILTAVEKPPWPADSRSPLLNGAEISAKIILGLL